MDIVGFDLIWYYLFISNSLNECLLKKSNYNVDKYIRGEGSGIRVEQSRTVFSSVTPPHTMPYHNAYHITTPCKMVMKK